MKKLIVASNNEHKIKEIKEILKDFPLDIVSLKEAGIHIDVEETGTTFLENAELKARAIFNLTDGAMVLADDSGISVQALGGAPGVYSARYAGEPVDSKENNKKLLLELKGKLFEERKASFICFMVLIIDKERTIKAKGEIKGYITEEEKGKDGFGYDPIFYIPEYKMTFAEMNGDMKNSMSHRGLALQELYKELNKIGIDELDDIV